MGFTIYHAVSMVLMALIIFFGNFVVVIAIIQNHKLHQPNNIFVFSTALADASLGLIGIPLRILSSINGKYTFNKCFYINSIYLVCLSLSRIMLIGMTFDRLFAIRFPFIYNEHIDCEQALIIVAFLWALGIPLVFLPKWMGDDELEENYDETCTFFGVISSFYLGNVAFFARLGSIIIISLVNMYILSIVRGHRRTIRRFTITSIQTETKTKTNKAEKIITAMIAALFITSLPLDFNDFLQHYSGSGLDDHSVIFHMFKLLYYSNSILNPIIYAYNNEKIYSSVKNVVFCRPVMTRKSSREECNLGPQENKKIQGDDTAVAQMKEHPVPDIVVTPASSSSVTSATSFQSVIDDDS